MSLTAPEWTELMGREERGMKKQMVVKYDPDCMTAEQRAAMEPELLELLKKHGWGFYASGCRMGNPRTRDIALDRADA